MIPEISTLANYPDLLLCSQCKNFTLILWLVTKPINQEFDYVLQYWCRQCNYTYMKNYKNSVGWREEIDESNNNI